MTEEIPADENQDHRVEPDESTQQDLVSSVQGIVLQPPDEVTKQKVEYTGSIA